MKYLRRSTIILGVMMLFALLGQSWTNVCLVVLAFIMAAMGAAAATTLALGEEDPLAPAVATLPSAFFFLLILLSAPAALHPVLGWSFLFGLLMGSAGTLAALAWGFGEGED